MRIDGITPFKWTDEVETFEFENVPPGEITFPGGWLSFIDSKKREVYISHGGVIVTVTDW